MIPEAKKRVDAGFDDGSEFYDGDLINALQERCDR
jgi:hypothetical protein